MRNTMHDTSRIEAAATNLQLAGCGMVLICAFPDTSLNIKCFSNIPQSEAKVVLGNTAAGASTFEHDAPSIINGDYIVKPPDNDELVEAAKKLAEDVGYEEPLVAIAVSEGQFCSFGIGDAPMLTWMIIRVLTSMDNSIESDLSMPNSSLN